MTIKRQSRFRSIELVNVSSLPDGSRDHSQFVAPVVPVGHAELGAPAAALVGRKRDELDFFARGAVVERDTNRHAADRLIGAVIDQGHAQRRQAAWPQLALTEYPQIVPGWLETVEVPVQAPITRTETAVASNTVRVSTLRTVAQTASPSSRPAPPSAG